MSEPKPPDESDFADEQTGEADISQPSQLPPVGWADSLTAPGSQALEDLSDTLLLLKLYSPDGSRLGAVRLVSSDPILMGRGEPLFGDPMRGTRISREHAVIEFDMERSCHLLRDRRSRNGTFLNGRRIDNERITPGDLIRVGDTIMEVNQMNPTTIGWRARAESFFTGASSALCALTKEISKVAPTGVSVLVIGETGVGKELTAQEVHRLSGRPGDLIAVNCAAIPKDLFESEFFGHMRGAFSGANQSKRGLITAADGGTLFLDEIGELDLGQQAKLLRVLQEQEVRPVGATSSTKVDVRIVAATNRNLSEAVKNGAFREDLLARIRGWTLEIPPLRERRADLHPITVKALADLNLNKPRNLSASFFESLCLYSWPANVRELVHSVQHAAIQLSDDEFRMTAKHLPLEVRQPAPAQQAEQDLSPSSVPQGIEPTRQELVQLLKDAGGRVADIARHTGRQRTQVYRWIKRYDLDINDFRSRTDDSEG